MSKIYTTEITSEHLTSDNPVHQRLFKAYVAVQDFIQGDVLEVGCGEGRGVDLLMQRATSFTAFDKIESALVKLREEYPKGKFVGMSFPPFKDATDNQFDCIVSFQVIEHIDNDKLFLQEIHRVLKPGGTAYITTPNKAMSLTRNPWHIREYLPQELTRLASAYFSEVTMKGITGNKKVMDYYEQNKSSVARITKWDVLNLQYRLPAWMLRIPYEMLNRLNRNKLQNQDNSLVAGIHHTDYLLVDDAEGALDLFLIVKK
jgi:2-polyprenyl-3-methyl-5-hydroxy-6-metoxy-1,4-benzoquinol methylase